MNDLKEMPFSPEERDYFSQNFGNKTRPVNIYVTKNKVGVVDVNSYEDPKYVYEVPLYEMKVKGVDNKGKEGTVKFNIVRFGIAYKYHGKYDTPDVVGLSERQSYKITAWKPDYLRGNEKKVPEGAYVIIPGQGWYLHSGSENTDEYTVGAVGCIEVDGKGNWVRFRNCIKEFSGSIDEYLIAKEKKVTIHIESCPKPKLSELKLKYERK